MTYVNFLKSIVVIKMSDWIAGNRFLGEDDIKNNAVLVSNYLSKAGFSLNAISAILANMEAESTINPAIWEGLQPYIGGYGLVQWTPYEKYSEWVGDNWQGNGDKECERIVYEFNNGIQFYPTSEYPISALSFKSSTEDPEYLASAFMHNYERPASYATEWYRQERARYWYEYIRENHSPVSDVNKDGKDRFSWLLIHRD